MTVECTRLKSGLTVVTQTMPHLESVALGVWIKSGSRNETTDEHGIAHLLEHMLFKGTEKRPDPMMVSQEIEGVGGILNAATGRESTNYWCKVPSTHFRLAYDVLADILRNSVIDKTELDKERSVIFEVVTRLVFHIMLAASLFLLFAGHNQPGGGFAGGCAAGFDGQVFFAFVAEGCGGDYEYRGD